MSGQDGIRFREALACHDGEGMVALLPALDEPHRVELGLGEALRDARGGFAAARAWAAGDRAGACRLLAAGEPDLRYEQLAAAYVAERRAPERWTPGGRPLDRDVRAAPLPDVAVAEALLEGVAGAALLAAFDDHPLHAAVLSYYAPGGLWAQGCRPLLVLAAAAGPPLDG